MRPLSCFLLFCWIQISSGFGGKNPEDEKKKMIDAKKKKVLFICTHNSGRSQMAEGFLRSLYPEQYEA
jgi:hypothetical protein